MIQIEKIEIVEFRGIRNLALEFKKKSFGIAGPNGTGKSGIVDAIEFALTGNITRLGGVGTADVSVKSHGPHVDASTAPEKAVVRITAFSRRLGKTIAIERTVKKPSTPTLTPDNSQTRELVTQLELHPEFALSRRDIVKYILSPAGERSKDVQILLRLDHIEKVRASLQRVANDAKRDRTRAQTDDSRAKQEFLLHLGITSATKSELLAAVNERRTLLRLDALNDLSTGTSIKEGVIGGSQKDGSFSVSRPSKAHTLTELKSFENHVAVFNSDGLKASMTAVLSATPSGIWKA